MTVIHKPSLSEIFAAMTGIICVGVAVKNMKKKSGLVELAQSAVSLKYDAELAANQVQFDLNRREYDTHDANLKRVARKTEKILTFLENARPLLTENPNIILRTLAGTKMGKARDVLGHIEDILKREKTAMEDRPREHFLHGTKGCAREFNAPYLEGGNRKRPAKEEAVTVHAEQTQMPKSQKEGVTLAA